MMRTPPSAWRIVLYRWICVLALAFLVCLLAVFPSNYFPFDLSRLVGTLESMGPFHQWMIFTLAFTLLWLVVIWLGGLPSVRSLCTLSTMRYPPFWFSVPIALILIWAVVPHIDKVGKNGFPPPSLPALLFGFLVLLCGVAAAKAVNRLRHPSRKGLAKENLLDQEPQNAGSLLSPEVILKWIEDDTPIQTPEEDFLGRAPIAERIAKTLKSSQGTTMCLVFLGSGLSL